ncbi:RNA-directed DNA polymerase (retron-type reverse transcriptase) [Desulforapulum autotrophicum HRM2]|uniref:RNA-directed DNA polymerase n=1 Tax=Desulforapulum autotrophicum (strain ATCC 43914 / DSM 3382 / VKM B-1955 / HRM2) TaxID=177437 RepID=C0QC06_DESAH|nr:reverse transcriptase family protein [Desulforapulum autotrophicum]ACN15018.1 RNA-directed DNA polymerase (retron-type reverse transcriptase) [Desulforapulum autotrophicum HRM2]
MPEPYSKRDLRINSLKHLAHRLGFAPEVLQKAASRAEKSYKFDKIPKKSGKGFREISKPNALLKNIQKAIHKLLTEIEISDNAHCGIKKRSNVTNAMNHCNKEWVYSMDFKNFFPNISHHQVYGLFRYELKCSPDVTSILTRLCTVKGGVPQGGSMSMDIANLVSRKLDTRLEGLCKIHNLSYTRHCDDLNFSGKRILDTFRAKVEIIIKESGFPLNPDKETLIPHHHPQSVVGLRVNRKKPCVPRKTRREWRKEKHVLNKFEVHGLSPHEIEKRKQRINGQNAYLSHINNIQP